MNTEPIVFSQVEIRKIEIPVTLGTDNYILREADGAAITERDNAVVNGTILQDGKPVRMTGLGAIDAVLLSKCLFHATGGNVKLQDIQGWPARVRDTLIKRLKEISAIDDDGDKEQQEANEEQLGNLSSDIEDGSS